MTFAWLNADPRRLVSSEASVSGSRSRNDGEKRHFHTWSRPTGRMCTKQPRSMAVRRETTGEEMRWLECSVVIMIIQHRVLHWQIRPVLVLHAFGPDTCKVPCRRVAIYRHLPMGSCIGNNGWRFRPHVKESSHRMTWMAWARDANRHEETVSETWTAIVTARHACHWCSMTSDGP